MEEKKVVLGVFHLGPTKSKSLKLWEKIRWEMGMRGKITSICVDEKPFMNIVFYVLLCLIALEKNM